MPDEFETLIDTANTFFGELARNNNRDWFAPQKSRYAEEIRKPAGILAEQLAHEFSKRTGRGYTSKVFRINRDVRFSRDKTPYNPHLHLMWAQAGREVAPGWFFGSSPDYLVLGCGMMSLEKEALDRFRARVDSDGAELAAALARANDRAGATLADYGPAPLKRVPKPFPPDHPQADLLRRKGLAVSAPLPADWRQNGLVASASRIADDLMPIWHWLDVTFS